jgi:hypothetical protein
MPDTNRAHDPAHSPWAVPTLMLLIATIALLGAFEALHEHWRTPRERARDSIAEMRRRLEIGGPPEPSKLAFPMTDDLSTRTCQGCHKVHDAPPTQNYHGGTLAQVGIHTAPKWYYCY